MITKEKIYHNEQQQKKKRYKKTLPPKNKIWLKNLIKKTILSIQTSWF
jgi:hypothetical protein